MDCAGSGRKAIAKWLLALGTALLLATSAVPGNAVAGDDDATASIDPAASLDGVTRGPSGLPLPRFVSLRSGKVNSRIGPGLGYPAAWLYLKTGLPMEITQEFDNWRKIRDVDGAEGWVNQALLSSRRTAMTAPWQRGKDTTFPLLAEPQKDARTIAFVQPGVVGIIKSCDGQWCRMTFGGRSGYILQSQIWGAYPGESVDD